MSLKINLLVAGALVFSSSSSVAFAQAKNIDCATLSGESLSIGKNTPNVRVVGRCGDVSVKADGGRVHIDSVKSLSVQADGATITVGSADEVWMPGDGNTLSIDTVSGDFDSPGDRNTITLGSSGKLWLTGTGNAISVGKVSGVLDIVGDGNVIDFGSAKRIDARGNSNTFYYGGAEPKYSSRGENNKFVAGRRQPAAIASTKPVNKPGSKPKPASTTSTTSASSSKILPAGLDNMWFIYNPNSGGKWAAMTFNDGSLTTDVNNVLTKGVAASRRANPKKWATYTKSNNGEQLIARFPNWPKARRYYTTDRSVKMNNNFKLTGCWQSINTSNSGLVGGVGSSTFSSNEFCFDRNGRFSNDSSFAISGSGGLGTSQAGKHGTYRISGNSLVLNYANGQTLKSAIGVYLFGEKTVTAISVGGRIYH